MNTKMESDPLWIDTPEGKWTTLSVTMGAVSIIAPVGSYLMIVSTSPPGYQPVMPAWVFYSMAAYFLAATVICLYNLRQVTPEESETA